MKYILLSNLLCKCVYVCICVHMCACVCVSVCVCVCVCLGGVWSVWFVHVFEFYMLDNHTLLCKEDNNK